MIAVKKAREWEVTMVMQNSVFEKPGGKQVQTEPPGPSQSR